MKQQQINEYNRNNISNTRNSKINQLYFEQKDDIEKNEEIKRNNILNKRYDRLNKQLKLKKTKIRESNISNKERQLALEIFNEIEEEYKLLENERIRSRSRYYENPKKHNDRVKQYQTCEKYKSWRHAYNRTEQKKETHRNYMKEYRKKLRDKVCW